MRLPCVGTTRPWKLGLLLLAGAGGCFLPLLFALGQPPRSSPAESQQPRALFGSIPGRNDFVELPVNKQPDPDVKKKKPDAAGKDGGVLLYTMPLTPPSADLLFRLESEEMFRDRLRAEVRQRAPKFNLEFPDASPPSGMQPAPRDWPITVKWVEPNYVVSRRLFFEQPRFERFGQSLGILQPGVSTGIFGMDLFLWPVRRIAHPFQCYQVNADSYSPYFKLVGE